MSFCWLYSLEYTKWKVVEIGEGTRTLFHWKIWECAWRGDPCAAVPKLPVLCACLTFPTTIPNGVRNACCHFLYCMKETYLVFLLPLFFLTSRLDSSSQYNDANTFKKSYTYWSCRTYSLLARLTSGWHSYDHQRFRCRRFTEFYPDQKHLCSITGKFKHCMGRRRTNGSWRPTEEIQEF